ncbi:MAG TPA: envelope integrity protein Cei [Pseudonocardiaceae bacterium]|jgi:LytR cell envelope-related transcriptional attenuator|nr:envelope integrity protein Cei [Pseudonocardiaceae bacterium]
MAAVNTSPVRRPRPYRTRKPMRAVLLALALTTVAGMVWAVVLRPDPTVGGCQVAAEATGSAVTPGQRLPVDGLDNVSPAPPQQVRVQVLNASGERGEAAIVGGGLSELGFAPTGRPANDPAHPAFDLLCYGEIRFGVAGQAAARTLSLALPCADLVRDARPDSMVDLALGTKFTALRPNTAARLALERLAQLGPPAPVELSQGGLAAEAGLPSPAQPEARSITQPATPVVTPILLSQARQVTC